MKIGVYVKMEATYFLIRKYMHNFFLLTFKELINFLHLYLASLYKKHYHCLSFDSDLFFTFRSIPLFFFYLENN